MGVDQHDASRRSPVAFTTYAVVTPARDEAHNLPRLAASLAEQTHLPAAWVIVENGSNDETLAVASQLAERHSWLRVVRVASDGPLRRGAPISRAVAAGFRALENSNAGVLAIVDADISMAPDHFVRLIGQFDADPDLGIASGTRYEYKNGSWRQQFLTGISVEASCRAYRAETLSDILPFEERLGWVGDAEIRSFVRGWKTRVVLDLPFCHHRPTGSREKSAAHGWYSEGQAAWYMGYRPYYVVLRALFRARGDLAALSMVAGYAAAAVGREPRHANREVRAYVRRQQAVTSLPQRMNEAMGRITRGDVDESTEGVEPTME